MCNSHVMEMGGGRAGATGGLFNNQNTVGTEIGWQAAEGGLFNTGKPNALGVGLNLGGGLDLGGGLNLRNRHGGMYCDVCLHAIW